jgi:23S rRNA (cytosine1962-C5)-methyltransferase
MRVDIAAQAAHSVRRGHPWVFRAAIARPPRDLASGSVVDVAAGGEVLGSGLWDASSPIAVRIHERADAKRGGRVPHVDEGSFGKRIGAALKKRDALFGAKADGPTSAFRLVNGEGDRVPGLVVDRYGHVAIVRTDGDAIAEWLDRIVPLLAKALRERGVSAIGVRAATSGQDSKVDDVWGEPVPERTLVREHAMKMEVDLARGQKTGAFLDQRENRRRIREIAAGKRVLNLFSYAGGFSLAAAMGGASRVTSVDVAAGAHATAQRSFRANDLDPAKHAFVTADAFDWLEKTAAKGEQFDVVISDPPSFAPSEKAVPRAIAAYQKLHRLCAAVLAPGGRLAAASCSSHVDMNAFLGTLDDTAVGRSDLVVQDTFGPPADHPTLAAFPEGRYLKLVLLA